MESVNRLSAVVAALAIAGCASGGSYRLSNGPQTPAAEGVVKTSYGGNGNTRLKITVDHLALPDKVQAGASVYVVWAMPDGKGGHPQSLGALKVGDKLQGTLETLTPLQDFHLTITPEPAASVSAPSGPPVLTAEIVRR